MTTATAMLFRAAAISESFAGNDGLDKFKTDLRAFIGHAQSQKYNDKAAPRIVLFSPIAHEDLHDKNLSDGKENNNRLKLYTQAMAEVAKPPPMPTNTPISPPIKQTITASVRNSPNETCVWCSCWSKNCCAACCAGNATTSPSSS